MGSNYIGSSGINDISQKYKHLEFFEKDGENCNFSWDENAERWSGNIYIPEVSIGLYETTNLFIIEQFAHQVADQSSITGEVIEGGWGKPSTPVQFESDELGRKNTSTLNGTFEDIEGILPNVKPKNWTIPSGLDFNNRIVNIDGGGLEFRTDGQKVVSISQQCLKKGTPYSFYFKISSMTGNSIKISQNGILLRTIYEAGEYYGTFTTNELYGDGDIKIETVADTTIPGNIVIDYFNLKENGKWIAYWEDVDEKEVRSYDNYYDYNLNHEELFLYYFDTTDERPSLIRAEDELELTVDYSLNAMEEGQDAYGSPGPQEQPAVTGDVGSYKVNEKIDSSALQVNIGINAIEEGSFQRVLVLAEKDSGHIIGKFQVYGEAIAEDERFTMMVNNLGYTLNPDDQTIFKSSDVNEWGPDWELLNTKHKEMLLEGPNIMPFKGAYKGLINAIKFFGYDNVKVKEYWLNIDKESVNYGKYRQTTVIDVFDDAVDYNDKTFSYPNKIFKKTSKFALVYEITRPTGVFDKYDVDQTEETFEFTLDEILIKLFGLKERLKKSFLPLNARIIDIIGEATYFSKIEQNVWNDQQRIDNIEHGIHPTFKQTPSTNFGYIKDLRDLSNLTRGTGLGLDTGMTGSGYKYYPLKGTTIHQATPVVSTDLYWWNPVLWDADTNKFNASWLYLTGSDGKVLEFEAQDALEFISSLNYEVSENDVIKVTDSGGNDIWLQVGDFSIHAHKLENSTGDVNTLLPAYAELRIGGVPLHGDTFTLTDANGNSKTFTFDHYSWITAGGKIGLDIHHKGTDGTIIYPGSTGNLSDERKTIAQRIATAINRHSCSYGIMELDTGTLYPEHEDSFTLKDSTGHSVTFQFDDTINQNVGNRIAIDDVKTDAMDYEDSYWISEKIARCINSSTLRLEAIANENKVEIMNTHPGHSDHSNYTVDMSDVYGINNFTFSNGVDDTDAVSESLGITAHFLPKVYEYNSGQYKYGVRLVQDTPGTKGNNIEISMQFTTGIENFTFTSGSDEQFSFLSWPDGTGLGIQTEPIVDVSTILAEGWFPNEAREEFCIPAMGGNSPTRTTAAVNKYVIRLNVKYRGESSYIYGSADPTHMFFSPTTGSSTLDGKKGGSEFNPGKDQTLMKISIRREVTAAEINDVLLGYFQEFSPDLLAAAQKDITALPDKCGIPVGYPIIFENTSFIVDWNFAECKWDQTITTNSQVFYDFSVGTNTGRWNTNVDHIGDVFTIKDDISGQEISYTVQLGDDESDVLIGLKAAFDAKQSGSDNAFEGNFIMPWDDYSAELFNTTSDTNLSDGKYDTLRLRRLSNSNGLSREVWLAITDDKQTSTTTSKPELQLQISSGNTVNTWDRFGAGNFYEIEWLISLHNNQDGNSFNYEVRGDLADFEKLALILPYTGKYDVRMRLYDVYNDISEHIENGTLEIGNKQAEFIGFYKFREKEYTWDSKPKVPKAKMITWNQYASSWVLPVIGDAIMDEYSDRETLTEPGLIYRGIDASHASLYESLDRANYILNKETIDKSTDPATVSVNEDVRLSYYYNDGISPEAASQFFTPGPYSWDNMNPGSWDDLYHLWWSSAKVTGDTPANFRITNSWGDNTTLRTLTINQDMPDSASGTHTFSASTLNSIDAAAELNASTDPVISKYVYNAVIHDSDGDGVADTEKYILAVAKRFGENGDFTSITTGGLVTVQNASHHEINNPTFNDIHFIRENKQLPKLTYLTFTYDKSDIPGKCNPEWHLINNDSPETDDIYFTGRWFTYLFKREGKYTVDLTLEDTNGNKMKKSRNIVIIK